MTSRPDGQRPPPEAGEPSARQDATSSRGTSSAPTAHDAPASNHAPVVAVAAFVFDGAGRVLLIERGKEPGLGQWTVPGGRVEPGEPLAIAVAREIREETGLAVEVGPLVTAIERIESAYHYVILDYVARATAGELRAGSDARAARWVADDDLADLPLTSGLVDVLRLARATYAAW